MGRNYRVILTVLFMDNQKRAHIFNSKFVGIIIIKKVCKKLNFASTYFVLSIFAQICCNFPSLYGSWSYIKGQFITKPKQHTFY